VSNVGDIKGLLDMALNAFERAQQGVLQGITETEEAASTLAGVAVGTGDQELGQASAWATGVAKRLHDIQAALSGLREGITGYRGRL
jgi:hypothetical protein